MTEGALTGPFFFPTNTPGQAMTATDTDRRRSWSQYWQHGALHSLTGSLSGQLHSHAILDFWRLQFSTLGRHDRVLDIGTGNGFLPWLLTRTPLDGMPQVDAIDLADVRPTWLSELDDAVRSRLHLHSAVAAEALPFPDDTFDLVVSQYGFEYADQPIATREVARVLKPGGRVALVMHAAGSVLHGTALAEQQHCRTLLDDIRIHEALRQLAPFLAQSRIPAGRRALQTNATANQARNRFNNAMNALKAAASESSVPDLLMQCMEWIGTACRSLQERGDLPRFLQDIDSHEDALHDAALRYQELVEAALDQHSISLLQQLMSASQISCPESVCLVDRQHGLMGWGLSGKRVDSAPPAHD